METDTPYSAVFSLSPPWSPWQDIVRILAATPLYVAVWRKKSIYLAIAVHCTLNFISGISLFITLIGQDIPCSGSLRDRVPAWGVLYAPHGRHVQERRAVPSIGDQRSWRQPGLPTVGICVQPSALCPWNG